MKSAQNPDLKKDLLKSLSSIRQSQELLKSQIDEAKKQNIISQMTKTILKISQLNGTNGAGTSGTHMPNHSHSQHHHSNDQAIIAIMNLKTLCHHLTLCFLYPHWPIHALRSRNLFCHK